jgi:hypothetical protein
MFLSKHNGIKPCNLLMKPKNLVTKFLEKLGNPCLNLL